MTSQQLPSPAEMRRSFNGSGIVKSFAVNYDDLDRVMKELDRHRSEPHCGPLVAAMISNKESHVELIEAVHGTTEDATVLNAIATQQKTPTRILERLVNHRSRSVAEHAELNLILRRLPGMSDTELRETLARYRGEDGVSLGVRHAVAGSPGTPPPILQHLRDHEEIDFIRTTADALLSERSVGK